MLNRVAYGRLMLLICVGFDFDLFLIWLFDLLAWCAAFYLLFIVVVWFGLVSGLCFLLILVGGFDLVLISYVSFC